MAKVAIAGTFGRSDDGGLSGWVMRFMCASLESKRFTGFGCRLGCVGDRQATNPFISARELAEVAGHADPDFLGSTHFSVDLTPDHDCGHCKEASI